jgi:ribonuclease D
MSPGRESRAPFIDSADELGEFLSKFSGNGSVRCAVDTEADSLHSYQEKLCLIQFNCEGHDAIIDPLAIDDLEMLLKFLERGEVWMHGADFDMSMFRRTFGRIPANVLDTQTAARLVGHRHFGLARMVEDLLGVKLSKGSQRANWGKRPLTGKMMEYAVNDVRYVLQIADHLLQELESRGRLPWFRECCEAARGAVLARKGPDPNEVWRVSGWGKLGRKGLAFLREAWRWRDDEARRMDRPPFKVVSNEVLLALSERFEEGKGISIPERFSAPQQRRFQKVVKMVSSLPKEEWPEGRLRRRVRKPPNTDVRFAELRKKRDAVAV